MTNEQLATFIKQGGNGCMGLETKLLHGVSESLRGVRDRTGQFVVHFTVAFTLRLDR